MTSNQKELRETITDGRTVLNEVRITKLRWGSLGWIITLCFYWRTRKLQKSIKKGEALLEFMETMDELEEHMAAMIIKTKQEQEQSNE